jgi:hypothetical protein
MTQDGFRKLALQMPDAIESAHLRHPDFRVGAVAQSEERHCSPRIGRGLAQCGT